MTANNDNKTPEEIANEIIQACIDNKNNSLNLSNLGLTDIPLALKTHARQLNQHLTKIILNHNQISKLENLEALTGLTSLDLGNNQITQIEKLETLEQLYLQNNKISDDTQADFEQLQALLSIEKLKKLDSTIIPLVIIVVYYLIMIGKLTMSTPLNCIFIIKIIHYNCRAKWFFWVIMPVVKRVVYNFLAQKLL